ncbi:MAG: glycogen synthase [Deltaproteobacteria bacterium]|nr:MAG: glycogen synthase [Deltaproteobacteria bacterium]
MKILYVTSEVSPWAKAGGLADISAALPRHLHARGHEVLLVVPLYGRVQRAGLDLTPVPRGQNISVRIGPHELRFSLHTAPLEGSDQLVHFVHCSQLYNREGLYTQDDDEHLRFIALSYAALAACQRLGFSPDIAHVHDWQSAIIPLALRCRYAWDHKRFGRTKTVLTIHNLGHQGAIPAHKLQDTGLADSAHLFHQDQLDAGIVNLMLTGILYADAVTTVSPTYAREIQTPELGMGLDAFLRARASTVVGILNGIDPTEWSPETDKRIAHRYSRADLAGKERNKYALLTSLGLPYVEGVPVAGVVSRLTGQKGLELVLEVLPHFLARGQIQLTVLGSGASGLEEAFSALQRRFPRSVCFYRGFSNDLAHQIEAGADLFLMPSRYEPSGLNQMYSMNYGTIPIVRATGGLRDSVQHFDRQTGRGTGVVFDHFNAEGLRWAVRQALDIYSDGGARAQIRDNAMSQDFSWQRRVAIYETLYERLHRG